MSEPGPDPPQRFDRLEDRAFSSIRIPARSTKPRRIGQTIVSDKGMGLRQIADLTELAADFWDWVKISASTPRILAPELIRRKIEAYELARIEPLLTGDFLELGINQGVMERVYSEARELGFKGVEVASAQVLLASGHKANLVRLALDAGLRAFAEVGRKGDSNRTLHSRWICREIEALLAAGADRVIVQAEGITEEVAEIREEVLLDIAAAFGTERVVFQAKDQRAQAWFIANFGNEVNLDVDPQHLLELELNRRGLRRRGLFGLVAAWPE